MGKLTEEQIKEQFTRLKIKERLLKLTHVEKVKFAVYCAEQVLNIYELKYKNNAPRLAIDAAKLFTRSPTKENKKKCKSAAAAADAAAAAADAAYAAYANAAAYAAAAAADAAAAAADAAYAAYANAAAYAAADAGEKSIKEKILSYLLKLESKDKNQFVNVKSTIGSDQPTYTAEMKADNANPTKGMLCNVEFDCLILGETIAPVTYLLETDKQICCLAEDGMLLTIEKSDFITWHPIDERTELEITKEKQIEDLLPIINAVGGMEETNRRRLIALQEAGELSPIN